MKNCKIGEVEGNIVCDIALDLQILINQLFSPSRRLGVSSHLDIRFHLISSYLWLDSCHMSLKFISKVRRNFCR